jgi:Divergent InlB B-repeat domain
MRNVITPALFLLLFAATSPPPVYAAPPSPEAPDADTADRQTLNPPQREDVTRAPNPIERPSPLSARPTYPIDSEVYTTRERTVRPSSITDLPPYLTLDRVDQYGPRGYSAWAFGDRVDGGARLLSDLPPGPYKPTETLLHFFSMSDIHIVDKESPVQAIFGAFTPGMGFGKTNTSAYSPVMLSTTHVLDAAVQTINALHRNRMPFDFGISLGDDANSNQYNELRWFIDVMDGKKITPSSGAHRGASFIDYQKPYQAAGLDKSIPWYQTMGNHDQFWCGSLLFDEYARSALLGDMVIDIGMVGPPSALFPTFDGRGYYMGVIDGSTEYGTIVGAGDATTMGPTTVAADLDRHALSTPASTTMNWMTEFFNTTSRPKGHGFTKANLAHDFSSYAFEPKADLPLKVIVLDDTCKENPYAEAGSSYARACLDQTRYDWLVDELDRGQADGKLMIIAAHIPVGPQLNVPEAPATTIPGTATVIPNTQPVALFLSTCNDPFVALGVPCSHGIGITKNDPVPPYTVVADASLLQTLHNYSNLILWISGHRHINTVTPQAAPAGMGQEHGFWEVETSSLRDFPQQFRTFEIVRNDNNTLSIFVTDVDPAVQENSPAAKSRAYAIGANRIAAGIGGLTDSTSRAYNAELIKPLPAPNTLTVKVTGPGTVTSSPYSGVNCGASGANSACSATYLPGTAVTLVAMPARGAAFAGWTPCEGESACTVTMSGNVTVTAAFPSAPTLAVSPGYKDFGAMGPGQKATALFTVRNIGTKGVADLVIGALSIVQSTADQFALVAGQDGCSGQTIKSGTSCTFQASFAPTSAYTKLATVTIPSNDPAGPESVYLTGVGK